MIRRFKQKKFKEDKETLHCYVVMTTLCYKDSLLSNVDGGIYT